MFRKPSAVLLCSSLAACAASDVPDGLLPGHSSTLVEAVCNDEECECACTNDGTCGGSPIIVDVAGDGFHLTDGHDGVLFDLRANGQPEKWSWTAPGSDDAWLALDRDGDGSITSGAELFGNHTDQPASAQPNGYLALGVFDENADGRIDASDPVFSRLRLWQDLSHDGVSQPGELHPLAEFGATSLSLDYHTSARVDDHGNVFRYRSSLQRTSRSNVNRVTYDVFLSNDTATAVAQLSAGVSAEWSSDGTLREASVDPRCRPPGYPTAGTFVPAAGMRPLCRTLSGSLKSGICANCASIGCVFSCAGDSEQCYLWSDYQGGPLNCIPVDTDCLTL
jgi:hypothetical protein